MTTNVLGPSHIDHQVVDGDDIDGRGRDGVKRLSAMFPRSPSIQSVKSLLGSLGARSKSTNFLRDVLLHIHTTLHCIYYVSRDMDVLRTTAYTTSTAYCLIMYLW